MDSLPICIGVLASLTVTVAPNAMAEWSWDVYGRIVSTQNHDVVENISNGGATVRHTFLDVKTDNAITFGGGASYWFDSSPWLGIGLDVFHFQPRMKEPPPVINVGSVTVPSTFRQLDFPVTAMALDLRFRSSLMTSAQFPKGQLQPYFSAGLAFSFIRMTDTNHFSPNNQSDTDTPVGITLGVGVTWQLTKSMAIFTEYRMTHFRPKADFTTDNPPGTTIHMKTDLESRHLLVGLPFPF